MAVIHVVIPQTEYRWFLKTVKQTNTFQTKLMTSLIENQLKCNSPMTLALTPTSPPCDIQVRISDDLKQAVQAYLKYYGITMTFFIRLAINQSMEGINNVNSN